MARDKQHVHGKQVGVTDWNDTMSSQASYIYLNYWAFENPPFPRNFQSLLRGDYGYFLEVHIVIAMEIPM